MGDLEKRSYDEENQAADTQVKPHVKRKRPVPQGTVILIKGAV